MGELIAVMPLATDADQDDDAIVYSLWDRDDPVIQGDRNEVGYADGDAAAFELGYGYDDENERSVRVLRTAAEYDFETRRVYEFRLVACDDEYNRAYIDITVRIDNVNEQLGRPDAPDVEGVSATKLVVRWEKPSNTGPDITDYDLQYRKNGTADSWRSWSHSGPHTNTVITGLEADTVYEVQVLARNSEGVSAWSPSGTGRTKSAGDTVIPVFLEGSAATRSIPENTPAGRNVGEPVRAEGDGTLTYSLAVTDLDSFDIVSSSGQIRTRSGVTYDHEAEPSYSVTVTATDRNGNNADIGVTISLEDVDEPPLRPAAPVVTTSSGSNTSLDVTWTAPDSAGRPDTDDYDLRYRRTAGVGQNCSSWCTWDHTGSSTEATIVDLESGTRYDVQVLAKSHEGESPWSPSGSGWTNTPGNTIPTFGEGETTSRSVPENSAGNQPVGAPVTATDDDANDSVTYSLEGVDAGSFTIESDTGQIKTRSGRNYDHEAGISYSVVVKATDSRNVGASIDVTITISDEDEPPNAPARPTVGGHSTKSLSVAWNPPTGNAGRPPVTEYDLQYRETPDGNWTSNTQIQMLSDTPTNTIITGLKENTPYEVQVLARNDEGDSPWSQPGSGRTLSPPTFPAGPLTRSFRETVGVGEPLSRNVGSPVRATFGGGPLTYTLGGGDGALFDIDTETGQIKTRAGDTYDYEAREVQSHSYSVMVTARDASDASATVEVTITITNATERPLAPGTPDVTAATTMSLEVQWDPPITNAGRPGIDSYDVQYRPGTGGSWRNGPQDVTGTTATIPDLDENKLYQVQVRATNADGNGPYSQPGAGWTTEPDPTNSAPVFDDGASTIRSFPENTPPNRDIGDPVTATDSDTDDTLTYSLHGTDAASFNIDFLTGQLRTRSGVTYDYETKDSYAVEVWVTDMNNASDMITVTINLTDVDESGGDGGGNGGNVGGGNIGNGDGDNPTNAEDEDTGPNDPPVFEDVLISRDFPENTPPGQPIGPPVTATDEDGDPLTYTLEGPDAGSFDIDPTTGQISTKPGVDYDYEMRPLYTVTVRATDPDGESVTILVSISVTDVPEPPAFASSSTVRSFPENTPPGRPIGLPVTASDDDGDLLTYSLEGPDAASFHIDALTGQLRTRAGVVYDYETRSQYAVTVRATDSGGGSGTIRVTINVTDVPEDQAFPSSTTVRSFPENTPPGQPIGLPVTAADDEDDPLTYTLQGPDRASFDIDASTGQLRTRAGVTYDYEKRSLYSVTVRATDPERARDTIFVAIHVTDVPEEQAFAGDSTVRSFPENTPPGRDVGLPVTAADSDGDTLTYTLEGPDAASFDLGAATGQLRTAAGVIYDYETRSEYSVTVRATDPNGASATIEVAINVLDVPEGPAFPASSTSRSFPENTPPGRAIGLPVTATDGDGHPLTYTLEGPDAESFDIDALSGQLLTKSGVTYDYETRSFYSVTVRATDPSAASDTIVVAVHVTNVPEPPVFADASTVRSFPENTPPGRPIGLPVTATDGDGDPLTYTLEGPDAASFDMGSATGQIRTRAGVVYDYETRPRYSVTARATDPGGVSDTILVTIHVIDVPERPLFAQSSTARSFPENTPPGRPIGLPVTAADGDGDTLAYTLTGPDAASFGIDAASGQVLTTSGVTYDYETRSQYSVTVRATDPGGASDAIVVAVGVTDVNEKPATPAPPLVTPVEGVSTALWVRWRAPDRDGGPVLTGYDLEYRRGSGGPWLAWPHAGTSTTTTLTALHTSADYEVRVRALNGEAPSDWSAPGSGRTNATVDGWLARFGRTVAQGMLDGVEERLRSPRTAGLQTTVAGYKLSDRWTGEPLHGVHDGGPLQPNGAHAGGLSNPNGVHGGGTWDPNGLRDGGSWDSNGVHAGGTWDHNGVHAGGLSNPDGIHWAPAGLNLRNPQDGAGRGFRLLTEPMLLRGSGFELSSEKTDSGSFGVWGRGGFSSFDGNAAGSALDGDVTTTTLGVDFAKGPWLAGLALSHSRGVGNHGRDFNGDGDGDDITAALTGIYPYAGFRVTDRLSVWGVGGFGAGGLTLTPPGHAGIETDIDLTMLAIAARGALLEAANGFNLALAADGFQLRATSEAVPGLLAADEVVSRVRLGLEGFYARLLRNGSILTPKLELGVRHDGGDAETGWGVDLSGGLLWSAPARGVHLELQARSLIGHQVDGFRDWSISGLVRYDPNPSSDRGLTASLRSSVGSAPLSSSVGSVSLDGAATLLTGDTLLAPDTLARPAAGTSHAGLPASASHARLPAGASHGGELIAEAAYGFPILGGRFTGSPWAGAGLLESGLDYRLGYRITLARPSGPDMALGIEAARREHHAAEPEHTLALRLATHW